MAIQALAWPPTENRRRATMQTPQGLDAKHRDELFLVLEFREEMEDRPA
jgi:hypothetical protein